MQLAPAITQQNVSRHPYTLFSSRLWPVGILGQAPALPGSCQPGAHAAGIKDAVHGILSSGECRLRMQAGC